MRCVFQYQSLLSGIDKAQQSKGITRRFNLAELRAPYAPDQDRQELPNSVVLDFLDGRTLQLACETYSGQVQVLASKLSYPCFWSTIADRLTSSP